MAVLYRRFNCGIEGVMSKVDTLDNRTWSDMPHLFWIVPAPKGHIMQTNPPVFAHQKSAEDYAKKQSQTNGCYYRVYKVEMHGTAIPQDSQFLVES